MLDCNTNPSAKPACTQGILTKGLGIGLNACSTLIIGNFRLGGKHGIHCRIDVVGSIPLKPGEIQNFLKPVDTSKMSKPFDNITTTPELSSINLPHNIVPKGYVKIAISIGDVRNEREFLVPIHKAYVILKMTSFINDTTNRIKLSINKFKVVHHNIKTKMLFLIKHKKPEQGS